jgi:hypothetical protein
MEYTEKRFTKEVENSDQDENLRDYNPLKESC